MATYLVLEDFAGNVGGPRSTSIVGAGTLLDDTLYNIPQLLSDGCPVVLYNPATMAAPLAAFNKLSGGVAQINPDGNLLALLLVAGVLTGTVVGPSNVIYVDQNGSDATGRRGNAAFPFATLAAAYAVLQKGDQIRIGPGSFTIAAPLVPPAGITAFSVVGSGSGWGQESAGEGHVTRLRPNVGVRVFEFPADQPMTGVRITDLEIRGDNASAVTADGTGQAGSYFLRGLIFERVTFLEIGGALDLTASVRFAHDVQFSNCYLAGGLTIDTCSTVLLRGTNVVGDVLAGFKTDPDAPVRGTTLHLTDGSELLRDVFLSDEVVFIGDATTIVANLLGNTLTVGVNGGPEIRFHGQIGLNSTDNTGRVDFWSAAGRQLPDSATALTFDFEGATFLGNLEMGFRVVAPAANRQTVRLNGATMIGNRNLQIGSGVDGVMMVGHRDPTINLAPDGAGGTFLAPLFASVEANGSPIAFLFPVPMPTANYAITALASAAGSICSYSLKAGTGFTITASIAGGTVDVAVFPRTA